MNPSETDGQVGPDTRVGTGELLLLGGLDAVLAREIAARLRVSRVLAHGDRPSGPLDALDSGVEEQEGEVVPVDRDERIAAEDALLLGTGAVVPTASGQKQNQGKCEGGGAGTHVGLHEREDPEGRSARR